ncbi:ribbon-helix-helix protein, CopG family [Svornostia abyssi]|uniref:Ribbon-helix-helix protein, CopG family n=1 Tax=Svornostia abyssi TaxID=2898438 RepID=A0ABY5PH25_9ACTN|nr:ribbon-helix-helix protein, CopG family [Parviterribacteraceae bacterium J379]
MIPEPTSDDIDRLLADRPDAGGRLPPRDDVSVHIEVPVDSGTLARLQERAERAGVSLTDVVRDLLRRAA